MWIAAACLALAPSAGDATAEGRAWLRKTEAALYAWPDPGSVVRFQVRTNLLDPAIEMLSKDPEASDPDKSRWLDALRQPTITGTLDTETGEVSTQVTLRYEPKDPEGKVASDKTKALLSTTIAGAFKALPFHDASMLGTKGSVVSSEEQGEIVIVKVARPGSDEPATIRLNQRTALPEAIEMPESSMRFRFVEVFPGRFAPSRLEVKPKGGKESRAEYAYQKAGEIAFPSTIKIAQGPQSATITFVSLQVEPRSH